MSKQLFVNNARTTMNGSITTSGTTLLVYTGHGSRFPTPTGGDWFLLTIFELDSGGNEIKVEVVKATARTADAITIVRDYESMASGGYTYDPATAFGGAVYIEARLTAAAMTNTTQNSDNLANLASASTARTNLGLGDSATKNTGTAAGTVAAGDHNHSGTYETAGAVAAHEAAANPHPQYASVYNDATYWMGL